MLEALSDDSGESEFFGEGSIYVDGICPDDISGRVARYRSVLARLTTSLCDGDSRKSNSHQSGLRQRESGLACFCGSGSITIRKARRLYGPEDRDVRLDEMVYALDSTTIDLCLSLFPWANFRKNKADIK